MVVPADEPGQVSLKSGIVHDPTAPNFSWVVRIAGAAVEVDLQAGLIDVVETHLYWETHMAACAWDEVSESQSKARRNLAKADLATAMQRIVSTAEIVLPIHRQCAARRNNRLCTKTVVVCKDQHRTHAKSAAEGKPVD